MAKHKQQSGFTLVEAVVTVAIIASMSALVLVGVYGAREKLQVRNAAQQFASDLREAILMTKNGVNDGDCKNAHPEAKRECSSYSIVSSVGGDTYDRKVIAYGSSYGQVPPFTLPGGVKFYTTPSNNTASFEFMFPMVGSVGATSSFTLRSKTNQDVNMCVSVISGGAVSVKSEACPTP
jgi:prepilin-type N-terminal cleavage/methylation domain-containing protein